MFNIIKESIQKYLNLKNLKEKLCPIIQYGSSNVEEFETYGSKNIFLVLFIRNLILFRFHIKIETDDLNDSSKINSNSQFFIKHIISGKYLNIQNEKSGNSYKYQLIFSDKKDVKFKFSLLMENENTSIFNNKLRLIYNADESTKLHIKVFYFIFILIFF